MKKSWGYRILCEQPYRFIDTRGGIITNLKGSDKAHSAIAKKKGVKV
jgi:hypothetical protein